MAFMIFTTIVCLALITLLPHMAHAQFNKHSMKVRVHTVNKVPELVINGKPTVPLVFFYNTGQSDDYIRRFQNPQVEYAASAGVHLYSMLLPTSYIADGNDHTGLNDILRSFADKDDKAMLILRLWPGPNPGWPEWKDIAANQIMRFADGTTGPISLASPYFWQLSNRGLREIIRYVEDGPYGNRVIGYHIGGPEFEMFPYQFREKGPDISQPNQQRFREWLKGIYHTDANLQKAWANPKITLNDELIPIGEPARFPMHYQGNAKPIEVFYTPRKERNWVDYGAYVSELAVSRIRDWARVVKSETNNAKLTVFCYGYTTELVGSFGAHNSLQQLLLCTDVDVLMSPVPYFGRTVGEPAGFMSPVDSIPLHNKLWLNEDDIRTSLVDQSAVPKWLSDDMFGVRSQTLETTVNLLDRNYGNLLIHRAASWWMDLSGAGAFKHPAPWKMLAERLPMYRDLYKNPTQYKPDAAVIIDERSKLYIKSDWDAFNWSLIDFRNQCNKSGAAVGYYTLQDFIEGLVPPCKLYLFPNAFSLSAEQVRQLRGRLDQNKSTAIWHYAPGYINGSQFSISQACALTSMQLKLADGKSNSIGEGLAAGLRWAPDLTLSPRLVAADPSVEVFGRYPDGAVSAAIKKSARHTDIFLGSLGVTAELLTHLMRRSSVHVWVDDGSAVQTDGQWLMVHSAAAGAKIINVPDGVKAVPLTGSIIKQSGQIITAHFNEGQTRWFKLTKKQ